MSLYRNQLNEWLKYIDVLGGSVLDVGGGAWPARNAIRGCQAEKYHILDNDADFKPDIFHDLNQPFPIERLHDQYDVIFCLEVMEYIYDPMTAHRNLFNFLNGHGIVYISYPTIYPLHNPVGIDYLRYTKNAIEMLLGKNGFATWEITPRAATAGIDHLKNFYIEEGMRAMKNTMQIYDIGYMVKAYKRGGRA